MRYRTDLMIAVLQSQNAQRIVDFIAPIYGESYVGCWLLEVIGRVLDEVSGYAASLPEQTLPQTATWSLPYWEEEYAITPDADWSISQRQANILAKMKYVPPINPAKLAAIASAVGGAPCEVIENISKNTFAIQFYGYTPRWDRVIALVAEAKPAHLVWQLSSEAEEEQQTLAVGAAQPMQCSRTVLPVLEPDRSLATSLSFGGNLHHLYSRQEMEESL